MASTWSFPVESDPGQATGDVPYLYKNNGVTELRFLPAGANGTVVTSAGAGAEPTYAAAGAVSTTGTDLALSGLLTVASTLGVTGTSTLGVLSAGASTLASLAVTAGATVGTTLGVTGASTLASASVTGALTVGTTLGVTGTTSLGVLGTSGLATMASASVTGNETVGGTLTVTGTTTTNGTLQTNGITNITGGHVRGALIDTGTGATLSQIRSSNLIICDATGNNVCNYILPAAAAYGVGGVLWYEFVFASSLIETRELRINTPAGTDMIIGTTTPAGGTGIATTAGTGHGIKNTNGTNVRGNYVILVSDGVSKWYMTSLNGIWAAF